MQIYSQKEDAVYTLKLTGRLNAVSAPQLENQLSHSYEGTTRLVLDFSGIDYISSAGLRVILIAQKQMAKRGTLVLKNVVPEVMDVFEMTGFTGILKFE